MPVKVLTEDEYLATMPGLAPVDLNDDAPFDFWAYVDAMPPTVEGYRFEREEVAYAAAAPDGRWQHVGLATDMPNVYVVLVLDREAGSVLGHRLLNLNRLYGIDVE